MAKMSKRITAKRGAVDPEPAPTSEAVGTGADAVPGATTETSDDPASLRDAEAREPQIIHRLDPRSVRPSAWANRHARSFSTPDFEALKASIASVGTNIQAIKVRPMPSDARQPSEEASSDSGALFEIVFGHRRHRACLELGVPVAAVIEPMADKELFAEMERENRIRKPLSPFEQGWMFKLALDSDLYASARALGQELGIDVSMVSKALSIARLPTEVIEAFASPLDIQYRWAGPLNEALRRDRAALLARAEYVQEDERPPSSVRVFQWLIATKSARREAAIEIAGRAGKASVEVDRKGRLAVLVEAPWSPEIRDRIEGVLREMLNRA